MYKSMKYEINLLDISINWWLGGIKTAHDNFDYGYIVFQIATIMNF